MKVKASHTKAPESKIRLVWSSRNKGERRISGRVLKLYYVYTSTLVGNRNTGIMFFIAFK